MRRGSLLTAAVVAMSIAVVAPGLTIKLGSLAPTGSPW